VARERPTASDVSAPALTVLIGGKPATGAPRPTRAEAQALRHSARQTHDKLTEHFALLSGPASRSAEDAREWADPMSGDCVHTVYRPATGNWANEAGSGQRVYGVHATREESVQRGRELARAAATHHVIHHADGTVDSVDAYGEDRSSLPRGG